MSFSELLLSILSGIITALIATELNFVYLKKYDDKREAKRLNEIKNMLLANIKEDIVWNLKTLERNLRFFKLETDAVTSLHNASLQSKDNEDDKDNRDKFESLKINMRMLTPLKLEFWHLIKSNISSDVFTPDEIKNISKTAFLIETLNQNIGNHEAYRLLGELRLTYVSVVKEFDEKLYADFIALQDSLKELATAHKLAIDNV